MTDYFIGNHFHGALFHWKSFLQFIISFPILVTSPSYHKQTLIHFSFAQFVPASAFPARPREVFALRQKPPCPSKVPVAARAPSSCPPSPCHPPGTAPNTSPLLLPLQGSARSIPGASPALGLSKASRGCPRLAPRSSCSAKSQETAQVGMFSV